MLERLREREGRQIELKAGKSTFVLAGCCLVLGPAVCNPAATSNVEDGGVAASDPPPTFPSSFPTDSTGTPPPPDDGGNLGQSGSPSNDNVNWEDPLFAYLLGDRDGDCTRDLDEIKNGTDPNDPTDGADKDCDGIPNVADADVDGDGVVNGLDNDVDGDGKANGSDEDVDGNGEANGSDTLCHSNRVRGSLPVDDLPPLLLFWLCSGHPPGIGVICAYETNQPLEVFVKIRTTRQMQSNG